MSQESTRRALLKAAGATGSGLALVTGAATADHAEDDPEYPSETWYLREQRNYARTREEPTRQANDPAFQARLEAQSARNTAAYRQRTVEEPGWTSEGNLCKEYAEQCCGDPFLYPESEVYAGDPFYDRVQRERVAFYDRDGARLSGHVWAPGDAAPGDDLPGVVITNGSVQAAETMYWWFAATLVDNGYVVLTYDPRGQGRSDTTAADGEPGTNVEPDVFVTNQVDAIDFFHSTPAAPYAPNATHLTEPAPVVASNPFAALLDRSRLGIVGHSAGAVGASVVQGLDPWPTGGENPVDAGVAWDNLGTIEQVDPYESGGLTERLGREIAPDHDVTPRVPMMGQSADYFLAPSPKTSPPDPEAKLGGFQSWRDAGVSTYQLNVRGGTHYEWARVPTFPTTDWESWGNELADHFSLAWLDRWLKQPGDPGFGTATDRLLELDEAPWQERLSFYYRSAYDFVGRGAPGSNGARQVCTDPAVGCEE
jgi:hypothetical protein